MFFDKTTRLTISCSQPSQRTLSNPRATLSTSHRRHSLPMSNTIHPEPGYDINIQISLLKHPSNRLPLLKRPLPEPTIITITHWNTQTITHENKQNITPRNPHLIRLLGLMIIHQTWRRPALSSREFCKSFELLSGAAGEEISLLLRSGWGGIGFDVFPGDPSFSSVFLHVIVMDCLV